MFVLRLCVSMSAGIFLSLVWKVSVATQVPSSSVKTQDGTSETSQKTYLLSPNERVQAKKSNPNLADTQQIKQSISKQTPSTIKKFPTQVTVESIDSLNVTNTVDRSSGISKNLLSNKLNPGGNPLLFPTKPSEVETAISQPITLEQAISLALHNNRELQASRIKLEERQARLKVEQADLFPTIDIGASAVRFRNDRVFGGGTNQLGNLIPEETSAETFTDLRGLATLNYIIYSGGERSAQITRAQREVRNQELEVERISEQTRFESTDRYYRLQNADAQVAIAQAAVEDANQSLRDARLLEQAGLGTRFDVLRAEGDLATANQGLTRAIAEQRTARRSLSEFLSVGQHIQLTAVDEISEAGTWAMTLDETIVRAYKNRAELEQQLVQREIGQQDRDIALSEIRPQVSFLAEYDARENLDDGVPVLMDWTFEARVRWRIFDGGRAFAGARQAERNIDLANTNFAKQRNAIRFEVEEAYYNLIANRENITSTRKNVEIFTEALRLARLRFQAGVGTQTDVIDAQRDLTDARGRFLQAVIGYNQSLNALQRSVSNLPDNGLFEAR
ncbi:TolC family protein [cyanobacterium endosymbiont of Epithemia turgida]|uniref:TolC family protein n=1 Tax=cyanobacterium endosymbiont of Epithemia turgida TaxID=718217 RepID=UPI0005C4ED61|nr:TolC family protein [cyanobacterium endosymbiont of Epithemia turgida]